MMSSELGKAIAIPAVIGALIAVPVPLIGPPFGALLGAAFGYYQHIMRPQKAGDPKNSDVLSDLAKLEALRQAGTITEAEFNETKKELLSRL